MLLFAADTVLNLPIVDVHIVLVDNNFVMVESSSNRAVGRRNYCLAANN